MGVYLYVLIKIYAFIWAWLLNLEILIKVSLCLADKKGITKRKLPEMMKAYYDSGFSLIYT